MSYTEYISDKLVVCWSADPVHREYNVYLEDDKYIIRIAKADTLSDAKLNAARYLEELARKCRKKKKMRCE